MCGAQIPSKDTKLPAEKIDSILICFIDILVLNILSSQDKCKSLDVYVKSLLNYMDSEDTFLRVYTKCFRCMRVLLQNLIFGLLFQALLLVARSVGQYTY